jgi:hypothetical protein
MNLTVDCSSMSLICACLCSQFKRNSTITPSQSGHCDGPQPVMQTVSLEHPGFVSCTTSTHVSSWKAVAMLLPPTQHTMAQRDGFLMTGKSMCPECRNGIDRAADHRGRRREHVCTKKCRKLEQEWFGIPRNVADGNERGTSCG